MKRLPILLAVLTSSLAFAGTPRDLSSTQASDDPRYGVRSTPTTPSGGAQPVDIMNWLIDGDGNLIVSNQIRDQVAEVLSTPIDLAATESWTSAALIAGKYTSVALRVKGSSDGSANWIQCQLIWAWADDDDGAFSGAGATLADWPIPVKSNVEGRFLRVKCTNCCANAAHIERVQLYLRAE